MRKLKLQVQMSVDGFIAGPNGEMDWMVWDWDEELKDFVGEITDPVDTVLLGRKLAEEFIDYWHSADPETVEGAKKMQETSKVVFTHTLTENRWSRTTLAKGDLVEEVNRLKKAAGGDLIVYGGASFVGSLLKEGLIDELNLFVNPTAVGEGMPIFNKLKSHQRLHLIKAKKYDCGITLLQYQKGE